MMDQYKEAFKEEAYEILSTLETALLELENKGEDSELIAKVFRALHTIKGSSGMFGFDEITIFTHNVENLYDYIRNGDIKVNKNIINLTLAASDQIRFMLDTSDNAAKVDRKKVKEIVAEFMNIVTEFKNTGKVPSDEIKNYNVNDKKELPVVETIPKSSKNIYHIAFVPSDDIFLTGTNPGVLLNEFKKWGICFLKAHVEKIPSLNNLDIEKCYIWWDIILYTEKDINQIKDVFIFVEDESEVNINTISCETNEEEFANICRTIIDQNAEITPDLIEQKFIKKGNVEKPVELTEETKTGLNEKEIKHQDSDLTSSIRVNAEKLDGLVNLVGELVTVQAHLTQIASFKNDPDFLAIAEDIERLTWELRDNALNIRMVPIEIIFNKFKRLVRDLSLDLGKKIEFITEGGETELDKIVIERLNDPLVHLIRNCIDHGIETPSARKSIRKPETGRILLSAIHSGSHVLINITDDGAGLDKDAILAKAIDKGIVPPGKEFSENEIFDLIFTPGFSTAKKVTNISGRGVGMDVVKKSIESMRGSVEIFSELGVGTTISLEIPLTLAIIEGLLVKVGAEHLIIPLPLVEECIELTRTDVAASHGKQIKNVRGELIPYLSLRSRFGINGKIPEVEQIVIINLNGMKTGIVVDLVIGGHQTVIKPLGKCFNNLNDISGATILGDGSIALILDIPKLIKDEEKIQMEIFESNYNRNYDRLFS